MCDHFEGLEGKKWSLAGSLLSQGGGILKEGSSLEYRSLEGSSLEYRSLEGSSLEYRSLEGSSLEYRRIHRLRTLGQGGMSTVHLVVGKMGSPVALKVVRKELLEDSDVLRHLGVERGLMEAIGTGSRFVVQYLGHLSSPPCLLLEPCLGGDLWGLMQRQGGRLEEDCARFYSGCVIEGLKYLASRDILYRDLKPENLLLDRLTGYLKLADLGFSRTLLPGEKAGSLVGTAEYLAPEMLLGQGYDSRASLWCLGVLIFELLSGAPPFLGEGQGLFRLIGDGFRGKVFPATVGSGPEEVVRMLCRLKPEQRPSLETIVKFSWFSSLDWASLRSGTLEAPLLPSEEEDCTMWDEYDENWYLDF